MRQSSTGFFGHPRGLATLFFTEAWERFSYYGMKAILLYYMYDRVADGGLGMDSAQARSLVSVYGAAIYLAAIGGGWLSDRLLGPARSTLYGGILIMFGHLCLALPAGASALYASMLFIVAGTGLLKPNVSTSVGDLYPEGDIRRDSGFTIYYMGISVGALIAPIAVGTLGQEFDYHLGFGLAAIGMAAGLIVFVLGQRNLSERSKGPRNPLRRQDLSPVWIAVVVAIAAAIVITAVTGVLTAGLVVDGVSALAIALPVAYFTVMLRSPRTTKVERARVRAYIPLFLAAVFFWIIQEQGATVLAQYADEDTDLGALGFAIPSSWFQSVGSAVLILITPFFATLWIRLARRDRQPSTPAKFGLGLLIAGLSYAVLVIPTLSEGKTNPLWLVLSFALVTVGEICLSPIGLSATTQLAPAAFATQTMGLWLAASAAGQGVSAQIVGLYSRESAPAYFGFIGAVAIVLGALLLVVAPVMRRRLAAQLSSAGAPATPEPHPR
ncbi:peptide MFS transporter [Amycolatopsis endophytica]|uniref:POT family proton-dependent oligopeptide transporter n=1 Tax=Amycolatopsis endophytica TaxID=860233 RepID=A0A853AYL5_9PSEU|nr:peptide MFS transporter [Amycolatopsis endophytica]NYI87661.1 POT family proton-dependent oligopeptide transporter [Amycolatopsis endophytica]